MKTAIVLGLVALAVVGLSAAPTALGHIEYCPFNDLYVSVPSTSHVHQDGCDDPEQPDPIAMQLLA